MLAAVGAPADLLERSFAAAQEEIEHTRLCFALAAGYGGRSHGVEPMPELLLPGALEVRGLTSVWRGERERLPHAARLPRSDAGARTQHPTAGVATRCAYRERYR